MNFDTQAKSVLYETIKILFPINIDPNKIIKTHVWRDRKYVGEANGRVVSWQGWSANLSTVDFRYRTIFIDRVPNVLSVEERTKLFGWDFAKTIAKLDEFVVLFVLDFPVDTYELILAEGFTPRLMSKAVHACVITTPDDFVAYSAHHWSSKVARLVLLQRLLSQHRKPLDAYEVPLQHLLFRSGYLHNYIVSNGLGLIELTAPRKAGDFGHDLHALVKHPQIDSYLNLGIEVYMGFIGYHVRTIPEYIEKYNLNGIIVVAKDDPFSALQKSFSEFGIDGQNVKQLFEMGTTPQVGVHHLPLQQVMIELKNIYSDIGNLIPDNPNFFDI